MERGQSFCDTESVTRKEPNTKVTSFSKDYIVTFFILPKFLEKIKTDLIRVIQLYKSHPGGR